MSKGKLGTDKVCQIGLLVHDVSKTGQKYADFFGVELPPVIHSGPDAIVKGIYDEKPTKATCKMMFFDLGGIQLELIQPDANVDSVWRADLNARGEGIHHIAFQVKDSKKKAQELSKQGYPLRMAGEYGDGSGCFHYLDTASELKMVIELLESY